MKELPTVALVSSFCPARSPPVRSASSRRRGLARWMVVDVHSLVSALAAARAFVSSSAANEELTHDRRESQLQAGQAARSSLIGVSSCDQASAYPLVIQMQRTPGLARNKRGLSPSRFSR